MNDQDPRTETLDNLARTGRRSTLKAAVAFVAHPDQWMTIEDVAIICGLSPNTIRKHSVRELFNAQIVRRKYTYDEDLEPTPMYKLNAADEEVEALREKARKQTRTTKRKIVSGLSAVDGGASEAKS